MVESSPANAGNKVRPLGQEDPLIKEMAIHSSTFAWEIPWTGKPGGLQSMVSLRVEHDSATATTDDSGKAIPKWPSKESM